MKEGITTTSSTSGIFLPDYL